PGARRVGGNQDRRVRGLDDGARARAARARPLPGTPRAGARARPARLTAARSAAERGRHLMALEAPAVLAAAVVVGQRVRARPGQEAIGRMTAAMMPGLDDLPAP